MPVGSSSQEDAAVPLATNERRNVCYATTAVRVWLWELLVVVCWILVANAANRLVHFAEADGWLGAHGEM